MKGQSKAIELVLVLFVLLVVAFVIIQIFQKFITEGSQKIEEIQTSQQMKEKFDNFKNICEQKCLVYKQNNCNSGSLVEFCSYSANDIDLNGDGLVSGYVENPVVGASFNGLGVCEEKVPCFLVVDCSCTSTSKPIDAKQCKDAICSHYSSLGLSGSRLDQELNKRLDPGACYDKLTEPLHWFAVAFDTQAGKLSCD